MPKKTQDKEPEDNSRRISKMLQEFTSWRIDLKRYWPEMEKCQEMYEFYKSKSERSETDTNISLNTPFAIIESQIAKENQATVRVTVKAKPDNDIGKFDRWVESILHDAIEDPDVAELHGTFRKTKEMFSRALKVVGNAAAEINYCYKTQVIDGEKKVIADNPYVKTRHYQSIVFNPAMQFDRSDKYYIDDWLGMEDLTGQEYVEDKEGNGKGLYKNLGEVKRLLKGKKDLQEDSEVQYISGDSKISRKNKPIHVITCWEGTKMTVIVNCGNNEGVIIREEIDPHKLGGHNLILGMRYCIEGRPYAYGEINAIYKPVRAQDTIVNQSIEIVNRYLRGSYIIAPGIDIDQFMMVLANGGAMEGNAKSVEAVPVNQVPGQAFQQVEVLQQAIERAARFSLQGSGVQIKKDQTATETAAVAAGAEPNVETQIDDIQDMFMQPVARKYLKMIGRLMGTDEVRYGLLQGETQEWVSASKGILMGKATLKDMLTVGLLDEEQFQAYTTTMEPVIDPMTGQPAIDPATGQPAMQAVPIPGAEDAFVFDVDWLVDAKLDNQSAMDKEKKNSAELAHIQWGMQLGLPINAEKAWVMTGKRAGFEEIDELLLSPEEQQAQQEKQMQSQQAQMMQQQSTQQQQGQQDMQKMQADHQNKTQLEEMKLRGQMAMQQMKPQPA